MNATATPQGRNDAKQATRRQNLLIANAREILQPSPVRPGIPGWFRRRLLKAFGSPHRCPDGWSVLNHAANRLGDRSWLDHFGWALYRDQRAFVAEPYRLSRAAVDAVDELSRAIGCKWFIDSNTWHFPGQTIRVVIHEPEENDHGG